MSIRTVSASPTTSNAGLNTKNLVGYSTSAAANLWQRNPSWPAISVESTDQKLVGLYAVFPGDGMGSGGNFFAAQAQGAYNINYGDGTSTNYSNNAIAYYEFNYNSPSLAGTDAPVTFTDTGDLVNRTAHGYTNGSKVQFYNIVSTTGITEGAVYYVINTTANTFQISNTVGGSVVALTTNGSGTLLPYKIATVVITPQAGQSLTSINLSIKHSQSALQAYSTGWLDMAFAGSSLTNFYIGALSQFVRFNYLERVVVKKFAGTSLADKFRNCAALAYVDITGVSNITSTANMFNGCSLLTSVPLFNTASVTDMSFMFNNCFSLTSVPLFNTASVTNMANMFTNCYALTSVPLFNTASVTNMAQMFNGCYTLKTVPLFNTTLVTSMASMFNNCFSLITVPQFNTASVTTMVGMFSGCRALKTVPQFNTTLVTSMSSMFTNCFSLITVPQFNTASVTNMASMFSGCSALISVPLFNTASVTNMASMFSQCGALVSVPPLNVTAVTSVSSMFFGCNSLARMQAKDFTVTFAIDSCKLSAAALNEIYTNLPTGSGRTITVSLNYGTSTDNPSIATAKGWTVSG